MTTNKSASKTAATKTPVAKPVANGAAKPQVKPAAPKARQKLIRDSFTIPKSEYLLLEALKLRAANLARPTKKSEVLRAGIAALYLMTDKALILALDRVPSLKTGRPKAEE